MRIQVGFGGLASPPPWSVKFIIFAGLIGAQVMPQILFKDLYKSTFHAEIKLNLSLL